MELGAGGMVTRRGAGRRRVRVGAGGRRRGSRPLPCPTVLGSERPRRWEKEEDVGVGGGSAVGEGEDELEGVDGDVVAVVELDGTVDGAAGVGLAEAVEAVEDGLVLADIEALERPNLVLLGLRHTRRFAPLTPVPPRPTGLLTYTRLPAAVAVPRSTPAMANWAEMARPSTTTTSSRPTSRSTWRAVARDRAPPASSP
uniref:Uncharacterized protein n=1 Tax=Oryza rufipogon TaxID=4529 RepID=A0A0E0PKD2_ORYRU